ncbi:MAG: exo-alpha-sialidase [Bacteroidaceae bacterium]|nr:exo-alpha-sialidase [Bacteroidaceae bacterium]
MKRILGLLVFIPMISLGYPTGFSSGSGYQDFAYVGLGNPNEVLAFAEYNGSISVGTTINYTLYGEYADYVERVRLWARPYESATTTNSSSVPATYAFPFDNRRPDEDFGIIDPSTETKNVVAKGAQLIAETTDYTLTSMKSTINLAQGNYVIYLTADIRSEDEVTLDLGEIWDEANYTKIGGAINNVGTASITTTNKEENGNRVLVTSRQPLYEPYDFYSKYYRIPCITTTSDGTLLAISDARKYHAHDIANDIDILVRRSTDNGKTWSAPVVVAKGEISGTPDDMDHAATIGYGDASIAAMPNGKVLLCMVKGNSIDEGTDSNKTWLAYRVSDDNGITWSAEKTVPDALLNNARGCIAPGNMCVPKEGVLKGKVLAAFRTLTRHDQSGDYHGNIFLIYDPDTGEWTRAYSNDNDSGSTRYIYNSFWGNSSSSEYSDSECDDHDGGFKLWGVWIGGTAKAGDDESVIVEVAENTFLVSNRYQTSPYRTFTRLVLSETPDVATGYKYVATKLTSSGFSATAANGSIIKTTDAKGKTFIIHAVPKSSVRYNSRDTRTALTIYTTEYDGSSTSIAWKERVCLSDPFGTLNENAQYSSMTLMADGTVGLLFEEYPQSVYANASNDGCTNLSANSDFIMHSVFMNVRPQDLIEEWDDVDYIDVAAPVITPESQTYHSEAGKPRPTVTITNPNGEGSTIFSMLFKKADGTTVTLYDNVEFEGDSYTIEWSEIASKIGVGEEDAITTDQSIIVTAKCSIEGNNKTYTSTETQRNYLFKDPVRKVMIYARPVSGSGVGNPTIVAGSQSAGPGEIVTVGIGAEVSITAFAATENPLISFSHFAYPTDTESDKEGTTITTSSPGWASTANVKLMAGDRQLVFKMQDVDVIPDNHSSAGDGNNDILVLYVFYNSQKAGFKSQVITSGHIADGVLLNNTNCSTLSTDDNFEEGFDIINTQYQGKDTTLTYLKTYSNVRANYVDAESNVNYKMTNEAIIYPHRDDYSELHLNVGVQPDSLTAKNLHAVVMFIQDGKYLRDENGQYYYALLQGQLHQHDKADPIYKGASIIAPWYGLNEDGVYAGMTAQPAVVSSIATNLDNENIRGIKFYDMDTYLTEDLTVKPLYVMIFVITNLVTDINTVVNTSVSGTSAMYVHVHRIIQTTVPTTVESVEQEDELIIASVNGGAQFIGYEARVDVYNMMGTLVATFPLNGTRYVELPQGIYIANGKKFVVR